MENKIVRVEIGNTIAVIITDMQGNLLSFKLGFYELTEFVSFLEEKSGVKITELITKNRTKINLKEKSHVRKSKQW